MSKGAITGSILVGDIATPGNTANSTSYPLSINIVDTIKPVLSFITKPASISSDDHPAFTLGSTETMKTLQYKIDGGAWTDTTIADPYSNNLLTD
jgi:hypothetical protein